MKPKNITTPQDDLFKNRLENMIDTKHKLVILSKLIDWQNFDDDWGKLFPSDQGAPAIPTRRDLCIRYKNRLKANFYPFSNFYKTRLSPTRASFIKITN